MEVVGIKLQWAFSINALIVCFNTESQTNSVFCMGFETSEKANEAPAMTKNNRSDDDSTNEVVSRSKDLKVRASQRYEAI